VTRPPAHAAGRLSDASRRPVTPNGWPSYSAGHVKASCPDYGEKRLVWCQTAMARSGVESGFEDAEHTPGRRFETLPAAMSGHVFVFNVSARSGLPRPAILAIPQRTPAGFPAPATAMPTGTVSPIAGNPPKRGANPYGEDTDGDALSAGEQAMATWVAANSGDHQVGPGRHVRRISDWFGPGPDSLRACKSTPSGVSRPWPLACA
jgi:hypothetical protein